MNQLTEQNGSFPYTNFLDALRGQTANINILRYHDIAAVQRQRYRRVCMSTSTRTS
jgi:hypothetical protein